MYIEFVVIYAVLGLIVLQLAAALVLLILLFRRVGSGGAGDWGGANPPASLRPDIGNGVVFCRNCAGRYSASERICPKCGTPR